MNTKTSNNSLFYRTVAIFMIAMLLLAAMPVSLAQAAPLRAVGTLTAWTRTVGTTGPFTITNGTFSCAAGANRLLVAVVTTEYNGTPAVMTLTATKGAGVNFTQAVKTTNSTRTGVWIGYLTEAQIAGNANSIVITESGAQAWQASDVYLACFSGVNQATPVVAGGTAQNSSDANTGSYAFNNVPAVNTGMIIYAAGHNSANAITTTTGFTEAFDADNTGNYRTTLGFKASTAATESGLITFGSTNRYGAAVVSLNPAPVAPVAPAITSANATTFTVGTVSSFTVTATGNPASTFSVTGALPAGITLSAAGVLSGTPATGTVGAYPVTITASNGTLPNATQAFTLTVQKANTTTTISSDLPDPSLAGQNVVVNYVVASAGNAIARTGNVTVSDGVNNCVGTAAAGTCTLALTTVGARTLTATYAGDANFNGSASAGAGHNVTASFIITASAGAGGTITPTGAVAVAGGANQAFSSTPNATFILSDVLVDGVSVGRANSYTFNAVAVNHTIASSFNGGWYAPTASVVAGAPTTPNNAFVSDNAYASTGSTGNVPSYTTFNIPAIPAGAIINGIEVAVEGYHGVAPDRNARISLSWNNGTNFTAYKQTALLLTESTVILGGSADNWGRLTWANTDFTNANFRVRVENSGGVGGPLYIDQLQVRVTYTLPAVAPTITSAAPANGTLGAAYTHTYTATGTAPITYSVTAGALPTGLTLTSAGVLSGTPTTIGLYTGTVTATNGTLPNATQNFSITINEAPAITSPNNASFTLGSAGTFTVTATGSPAPTFSVTGVLPAGVTFTSATGVLAGTPAAGTGGIYPLTFTAANGVLPNATQSFTLTVTDGPSITSANNTSFSLGLPGTFTVTAVGLPAPTLSMTGTLPAGVTFTPATGILAGTPAAGTVGSYLLTFTATNGILPNATQAFTLTVKNGPIVAPNGINSVPDTGNGSISNNESIANTLGITQLIVKFDQDVYDPAGNTDPKDVTNPANYMLALGSSSGVFQTVSCLGGIIAPDAAISVDSVTYSNGGGAGPFVATVNINGGLPLNANGFYRLYVCGTTSIVDAVNINLELAGNGTTPGTDFLINFRIQARATGGGGGGNNNTASTTSAKATLIPVTGFAPDKVTVLPAQPADKAYKSLGEIRIEIPSLGINYPIVGAMIDKNTWDLTWLKDSVAYLEGSAYPTLPGNTVLTAHVADANNNLGPFSDIKGLQTGQKIYIHANGQTYVYQVQDNQKIFATNISAAFKHEENSWITLVTCEDYNAKTGAYKYRRMVRAVLISVISEK